MYFMYGDAQGNGVAAQRMYDSRLGMCRIAEHMSVFIKSCAQVDRCILSGVIWAIEDIAEFVQ